MKLSNLNTLYINAAIVLSVMSVNFFAFTILVNSTNG